MVGHYTPIAGSDTPPTPLAITPEVTKYFGNNTFISAWWLHMVIQSLCNVVVAAGLTPLATNLNLLTQAVIRLGNGYDPKGHGGPAPVVASATTVTLPAGLWAVDPTTGEVMKLESQANVAITATGANALDTGTEANSTWYYVWLIKHGTNGTVAGLLSTSATAPTLPSGYTHKRLIFAVRNDASGNFIQGECRSWGGGRLTFVPSVQHAHSGVPGEYGTLVALSLAATTFTDLDCASQLPANVRFAELWARASAALVLSVRENGKTHNGHGMVLAGTDHTALLPVRVDANRVIEYKVSTSEVAIEVFSWTMEL